MSDPSNFDRPMVTDLLASLDDIVGGEDSKSAIARGLREVKGATTLEQLSPPQLLELALALARQRGLVAVIGRSFAIRMRAYIETSGSAPNGEPTA